MTTTTTTKRARSSAGTPRARAAHTYLYVCGYIGGYIASDESRVYVGFTTGDYGCQRACVKV